MQRSQKPKNEKVYITKPFLKGSPTDSLTVSAALKFFGSLFAVMIIFLIMGMMMMIDNAFIRIALNVILLAVCYMIYYSFGLGSGTSAVNQGEILQGRLDRGGEVHDSEKACCYHAMKGFVSAMIGSVPIFLAAAVFACLTTRQMTTMGALPSWVSELSAHEEVTTPVGIYDVTGGMSIVEILRVIIRMTVMPYVNIFDSTNYDAMLLLERISPVLTLLPAVAYGIGYTQGPKSRARVHGDIAQGKRRLAKKQRREHKRRVASHEPQQLN